MKCRLATHEYKESDNVRSMRRLDNMYLLDFQEVQLKNVDGYKKALKFLFETKVKEYCLKYPLFVLGDWPTQFYLRQIVYNHISTLHSSLAHSVDSVEIPSLHIERPFAYNPKYGKP